MLQHLNDPVAALREMSNICKPGSLIAVRDSDDSGFTWYPAVPEIHDWLALYPEVAHGNDAEPDAARRLEGWALAAGLDVIASTRLAQGWRHWAVSGCMVRSPPRRTALLPDIVA